MTFLFAIAIGILSALVVLIVLARMDIKKFMGYPAIMDVLVTVILVIMLHGTYVGMVAAIIGGLVFSGAITIIRKVYGYRLLTRKGWVTYDGVWTARVLTQIKGQQDVRT